MHLGVCGRRVSRNSGGAVIHRDSVLGVGDRQHAFSLLIMA
jgi:hypothetical protein